MFSHCSTGGLWYKTTICRKLHGLIYKYFFITATQDRYALMCGLNACTKLNKIYYLVSLCVRLNFVDIWFKPLADNFAWR